MNPDISEGKGVDFSILGEEPALLPLHAMFPSGKSVEIEDKKAIHFGGDSFEVVGDAYRPVSHREVFSRLSDAITKEHYSSRAVVKVETSVMNECARARVIWTLFPEDAFTIGGSRWMLQLRAFNSYDGFFSLSSELGLVNVENSARVAFRSTSKLQRRRGDDPVGNLVGRSMRILENAEETLVPDLNRLEDTPVGMGRAEELLSEISDKWVTQKGKEEILLKFEADYCCSLWDWLAVVGWFGTNRLPCSSGQIFYRQELLYREMARVAGI